LKRTPALLNLLKSSDDICLSLDFNVPPRLGCLGYMIAIIEPRLLLLTWVTLSTTRVILPGYANAYD
jgi:hypothetical protein